EEMVAGTERAALFGTAQQGAVADLVRIGAIQPAVRFSELEIALGGEIPTCQIARTLREQPLQLLLVELVASRFADTGRHLAEQLFHERPQPRLDILVVEVRANEPNAAVDVVADAARRDDATLVRIGRTDAADAEAVAPVDVRHRQAGVLDPRQEGDIRDLV